MRRERNICQTHELFTKLSHVLSDTGPSALLQVFKFAHISFHLSNRPPTKQSSLSGTKQVSRKEIAIER